MISVFTLVSAARTTSIELRSFGRTEKWKSGPIWLRIVRTLSKRLNKDSLAILDRARSPYIRIGAWRGNALIYRKNKNQFQPRTSCGNAGQSACTFNPKIRNFLARHTNFLKGLRFAGASGMDLRGSA